MDKNDIFSNPYKGFDLEKILGRQNSLSKQNPDIL